MRKKNLLFILFCFIIVFVSAADSVSEYESVLKEIDKNTTFKDSDLSAEYTITTRKPGGSTSTTVAAMFRRDRTGEFLILIIEPEVDKGKGYLKKGDNLWLYDPVGRSFTFTSAKERFQNSSARNSDFNRSNFSEDYKVVSGKKTKLGKFICNLIELESVTSSVSFPKMKIWVSEGDNLARKIEDYSLSGQLMRTTAIPSYQKVGKKWVPLSLVIVDHLNSRNIGGKTEYERTYVKINKPSLSDIPDTVYTKEYLERVNR